MALDGSAPSKNVAQQHPVIMPVPGGVYWCHAPYKPRDRSAPITPGPDPHPVLVLTVYDEISPPEVLIAPGTGTLGGAHSHLDFEVMGGSVEAQAMGLTKTTRFKMSGLDRIPFVPGLFVPKNPCLIGIEHSKIGAAPASVVKQAIVKYAAFVKFVDRLNKR